MKTSVGFWDSLFGERVTLEIPMPHGGVKRISVTKKWLEQRQRGGEMKRVSPATVQVHILDPMGDAYSDKFDDPVDFMEALGEPTDGYRMECWKVGEQVSQAEYDRFLDPETKELYVVVAYEDGKRLVRLAPRRLWEQTRKALRDV